MKAANRTGRPKEKNRPAKDARITDLKKIKPRRGLVRTPPGKQFKRFEHQSRRPMDAATATSRTIIIITGMTRANVY